MRYARRHEVLAAKERIAMRRAWRGFGQDDVVPGRTEELEEMARACETTLNGRWQWDPPMCIMPDYPSETEIEEAQAACREMRGQWVDGRCVLPGEPGYPSGGTPGGGTPGGGTPRPPAPRPPTTQAGWGGMTLLVGGGLLAAAYYVWGH